MNRKIFIGLCLVTLMQFFVLSGMYVVAAIPLWTGTEVRLKTVPVDPRSLFRGNYARLNYAISTIGSDHFPNTTNLRNGEIVYVTLESIAGNLYEFKGVSLKQPSDGVFLRGRVERFHTSSVRVRYGIEAFFAPKDKALELQKTLSNGAVAVVMVSDSGRARLKDIVNQ